MQLYKPTLMRVSLRSSMVLVSLQAASLLERGVALYSQRSGRHTQAAIALNGQDRLRTPQRKRSSDSRGNAAIPQRLFKTRICSRRGFAATVISQDAHR